MSDAFSRTVLLIIGLIVALPLVMLLLVAPFGMMGTGMAGGGWGSWFGFGMWVLPVLLIIGIGFAIYLGVTGTSSTNDAAITELRQSYARGEIDDEEFERRRSRLQDDI